MLSPGGFVRLMLERLLATSTVYTHTDTNDAFRCAKVLEGHLVRRFDRHCGESQHSPMLFDYTSDTASYLCRSQHNMSADVDGHSTSIQRRGRHLQEFLTERFT